MRIGAQSAVFCERQRFERAAVVRVLTRSATNQIVHQSCVTLLDFDRAWRGQLKGMSIIHWEQ
jgi:hypothetical protein